MIQHKVLKYPEAIAVVGLGYVGLSVALAFSRNHRVIGFDIDHKRVTELQDGVDSTGEATASDLKNTVAVFTSDPDDLSDASFFIVAVPTPITGGNQPDLRILVRASEIVGGQLKSGDIVVYESTVYPGVTEDDCAPILEKSSGLSCGTDFFVGYSPERVNPGDKEHTFVHNTKIVAGQTQATLEVIAAVYASVVKAGVYRASSIKVAEAAKVIENTQRDLNIALVNELAIIFHRLGLDTKEVLDAARTKWNFLHFAPGLVGGHCISVDPYYLTHKAELTGYYPHIILAGRRVNDGMGKYIAEQAIKQLIRANVSIKNARIGVLGFTFKENCPDIRNTQVSSIIRELQEYGITPLVHDPLARPRSVKKHYGIVLSPLSDLQRLDGLILAVAHTEYLSMPASSLIAMLTQNKGVIIDVKSVLDKTAFEKATVAFWRL